MRRWLLKKLNAVDRKEFIRLIHIHKQFVADTKRMVEIHHLQSAWQEAQVERKERRYH